MISRGPLAPPTPDKRRTRPAHPRDFPSKTLETVPSCRWLAVFFFFLSVSFFFFLFFFFLSSPRPALILGQQLAPARKQKSSAARTPTRESDEMISPHTRKQFNWRRLGFLQLGFSWKSEWRNKRRTWCAAPRCSMRTVALERRIHTEPLRGWLSRFVRHGPGCGTQPHPNRSPNYHRNARLEHPTPTSASMTWPQLNFRHGHAAYHRFQ